VIEVISAAAKSDGEGKIGDGKIFVNKHRFKFMYIVTRDIL
jgi:nitrogen regulatory protein PII